MLLRIVFIITWSKATLYTTVCMEATFHKLIRVKTQHFSIWLYIIFLFHKPFLYKTEKKSSQK